MVQPRESNPRPPALQSCALPTELIPPVQSEIQNNVKFQICPQKYSFAALMSASRLLLSNQTLHYSFISSLLAQFIWRKVVPKKRVTLQLSQRKKIVDPFARAKCTRTCSDCLALTKLTQLGEPKCLREETSAGREGGLTFKKGWTSG